MASKAKPKQDLGGELIRKVISKHPDSEMSSPIGRSTEFQGNGYHTKPNGDASNTRYGGTRYNRTVKSPNESTVSERKAEQSASKGKDFKFFKHSTGKVPM